MYPFKARFQVFMANKLDLFLKTLHGCHMSEKTGNVRGF